MLPAGCSTEEESDDAAEAAAVGSEAESRLVLDASRWLCWSAWACSSTVSPFFSRSLPRASRAACARTNAFFLAASCCARCRRARSPSVDAERGEDAGSDTGLELGVRGVRVPDAARRAEADVVARTNVLGLGLLDSHARLRLKLGATAKDGCGWVTRGRVVAELRRGEEERVSDLSGERGGEEDAWLERGESEPRLLA